MIITPSEIQREIDEVRRKADRIIDGLQSQLEATLHFGAVNAASQERQREASRLVLERFESGWWISGSRRMWWHSPEEVMVAQATPEEVHAADRLVAAGVIDGGELVR